MKWLNKKAHAVKRQGGFTLVEIVVVLVIIAILATLMLGALNGYIDKAKEKQAIALCRSVVLAGDTVGAEIYAGVSPQGWKKRVAELADVSTSDFAISFDTDCAVSEAWCQSGGVIAKYDASSGTIEIVSEMGVDYQYFPLNGATVDVEEGEESYGPDM